INAVRLCVGALAPLAITVMLNRFDGRDAVHESNREWLAERDGLPVVTTVRACVTAVLGRPIEARDPDGRLAE
ncbi:MAG TPA: hypothetical protein VM282_13910, partial [Acidimicrobiales bacterium]|nr:hypothetical protein [Acidimicrobiales bacterium]